MPRRGARTSIFRLHCEKGRLADETEPEFSPLWNEARPERPLVAEGLFTPHSRSCTGVAPWRVASGRLTGWWKGRKRAARCFGGTRKTQVERSNRSFDGVCVEEDTPHTGGCILYPGWRVWFRGDERR